jgi:hypothetical protein
MRSDSVDNHRRYGRIFGYQLPDSEHGCFTEIQDP